MTNQRSTLAQLRDDLDVVERRIVVMHETAGTATEVVRATDRIASILAMLSVQGIDVRAEANRADAILRRLLRDARRVSQFVLADGMASQLSESPTWRSISAAAARERRDRAVRFGLIATALVSVGLLVFVVLPRVFPAPPTANIGIVQDRAAGGDLAGALELARAEQARVPDDEAIGMWIGALELAQGNREAAEAAWLAARRHYPDEMAFRFDRGRILSLLQVYEPATVDAQALLALPGGAAQGHFLLGQIAELRGDLRSAYRAFEQASQLAEQAGDTNLVVLARTRMAYVAQRLPATP